MNISQTLRQCGHEKKPTRLRISWTKNIEIYFLGDTITKNRKYFLYYLNYVYRKV
jgi:hypothetical protein